MKQNFSITSSHIFFVFSKNETEETSIFYSLVFSPNIVFFNEEKACPSFFSFAHHSCSLRNEKRKTKIKTVSSTMDLLICVAD